MTKRSRKNAMNLPLKVAIAASGLRGVEIARRAGMHENRMSQLVTGRRQPNANEKKALARILKVDSDALFPVEPSAVAS